MHYYTHNIGEFAIETKYMTFEQKGIYVDLIDHYLATSKPLASEWLANFKRLAGEGAVDTVLNTCFEKDGDVYRSEKLDFLIEEYEKRAEKNRENARKSRKNAEKTKESSESLASGKRVATESLTTNNHKPITKNQEPIVVEGVAQKARPPLQTRNPAKPLEFDSIPGDWKKFCEDTRPDLDPYTTFKDFHFYWLHGHGKGTRRSDRGWNQTWANWVKKERPGSRKANDKNAATQAFLKDLLG